VVGKDCPKESGDNVMSRFSLTDEDVEKALKYLAETDQRMGELRGVVEAMTHRLKVYKAQAFVALEGKGTIADREHKSILSQAYLDALDDYKDKCTDYRILEARRSTAVLRIDVWRTQESSRRRG